MLEFPAIHSPQESVYDAMMNIRLALFFNPDEPVKVILRENAFGLWLSAIGEEVISSTKRKKARQLIDSFADACQPFGINLTYGARRAILDNHLYLLTKP